jgi:hypothetical protein
MTIHHIMALLIQWTTLKFYEMFHEGSKKWNLYVPTIHAHGIIILFFQVNTWVLNNYFIFKIHFNQNNNNKWNLTKNIGNIFDIFLNFEPLTYNLTFSNNLNYILFANMGRHNVPPNYRIQKGYQLLNTCCTIGLA